MLLATKLVVFIGFSFTDYDFSSVYSLLKEEMKDVLPHSYAVTVSSETAGRFKELGISPIITDGTKFLEVLKARLVADGRMIPDKAFDAVDRRRFQIEDAHLELHNEFSYKENPELIYCAFYQDGLMDAFNRFSVMKKTGECSCPFEMHQRIDTYDRLKKTKKKEKKYDDVAYIEGYSNGLKYVLFDEKSRKKLPVYFLFGYKGEIIKLSEYRRLAKMAREMHRSSYDAAVKITKTTVPGIQIQHTPFLL